MVNPRDSYLVRTTPSANVTNSAHTILDISFIPVRHDRHVFQLLSDLLILTLIIRNPHHLIGQLD